MRKWIDIVEGRLDERARLAVSDAERLALLEFMVHWFSGRFMGKRTTPQVAANWERIHKLFPPRLTRPVTLMRLVTLPIKYANMKSFHLDRPAPGSVASWSSVPFGIESVAGIASEFAPTNKNTRIVIKAKIAPENILVTRESMKRAFLSLSYDWDYARWEVGRSESFYLGSTDEQFRNDMDYYHSIFVDQRGGPLRQYEFIVRTTPLDVVNVRTYRVGGDVLRHGHDDPHNSDDYRGWVNEELMEGEIDPTALAHEVANELLTESGLTPLEFNDGRCMEFSDELEGRDPRFESFELGNFYNHPEGSDCGDATGFGEKWLARFPEWRPPQGLTWQDLYDHYGFNWTGTHMWAFCSANRLCYDIEAPEGVLNLLDLPFFQRLISGGPYRWG